jgi:hypothetical protein
MAGNEASAIGSMRAVIDGQSAYSSSCAHGGHAASLADWHGPHLARRRGFVSPDLNGSVGEERLHRRAVQGDGAATIGTAGTTCNGSTGAPVSAYEATADPTAGATGTRYFATDTRGTESFSNLGSFGTAVIPAAATPVQ